MMSDVQHVNLQQKEVSSIHLLLAVPPPLFSACTSICFYAICNIDKTQEGEGVETQLSKPSLIQKRICELKSAPVSVPNLFGDFSISCHLYLFPIRYILFFSLENLQQHNMRNTAALSDHYINMGF